MKWRSVTYEHLLELTRLCYMVPTRPAGFIVPIAILTSEMVAHMVIFLLFIFNFIIIIIILYMCVCVCVKKRCRGSTQVLEVYKRHST
jgi:hypothetical protein